MAEKITIANPVKPAAITFDGPAATKFREHLDDCLALCAQMQLELSGMRESLDLKPESESFWLGMAKGIARGSAEMQMHDDSGSVPGGL